MCVCVCVEGPYGNWKKNTSPKRIFQRNQKVIWGERGEAAGLFIRVGFLQEAFLVTGIFAYGFFAYGFLPEAFLVQGFFCS